MSKKLLYKNIFIHKYHYFTFKKKAKYPNTIVKILVCQKYFPNLGKKILRKRICFRDEPEIQRFVAFGLNSIPCR